MTLEKTIDVLKHHNKWRRGVEGYEMLEPKVYGEAIDIAIEVLSEKIKHDD